MFLLLLILFIAVPVAELMLLIRIGQAIDLLPTLTVVILTGVIGAALARHQGLRTLSRINEAAVRGEMPTEELLDGLMILVAAVVLVTPGVMTDALGFALLVPPIRTLLRRKVAAYFKKRMVIMTSDGAFPTAAEDDPFTDATSDDVIDVDVRVIPKDDPQDSA